MKESVPQLKNPKAMAFYTKGLGMMAGAFEISPGTPEWSAWEAYFATLGWFPWVMRREAPATMPTQWPQWFDSSAA
jgi:hypothetical protein